VLDERVHVWYDDGQPDQVHLTVTDSGIVHPYSRDTGLHLVFSALPESVNYHPKTFNTLRALLAALGKPHPEREADESIPRHRR